MCALIGGPCVSRVIDLRVSPLLYAVLLRADNTVVVLMQVSWFRWCFICFSLVGVSFHELVRGVLSYELHGHVGFASLLEQIFVCKYIAWWVDITHIKP